MDIRPIRTEADRQAALEEIERLFDARPNTSEGDRMEALVALVDAYEAQHCAIPAPDPDQALKYYMESRLSSRTELDPDVGGSGPGAEGSNRADP